MCSLRTVRSLPSLFPPLHAFSVCFLSTYCVPGAMLGSSERAFQAQTVFRAFALALSSALTTPPP